MQSGASEQEIIERLKAKRNPEPVEPTDYAEPELEESEDLEDSTDDEPQGELIEELGDSDDDMEDGEELYYQIDGEEVDLNTILSWKNGHMMQSDYTKKTQSVAEKQKAVSAKEAELQELTSSLQSTVETLEAELMREFDSIDWDDLRDLDTSEYLKKKEQLEQKRKLIETAKSKQSTARGAIDQAKIATEQQKLYDALPHWSDEKKRNEDIQVIADYAKAVGYTDDELKNIHDHRLIVSLLKAGKLAALEGSDPKNSKRIKKKPNITKPNRKRTVSNLDRQIEEARAKFKQTGKVDDGVAYQRLKKQKQRGN